MPHGHPRRHPRAAARHGRAARPRCEALEGRALLAVTAPGPTTFGQRGVVLGPVVPHPAGTYQQSSSVAAVQADGKVVVVTGFVSGASTTASITVTRYDVDGSVDATFGAAGSVGVAVPAGDNQFSANPAVALAPDGGIVVVAGVVAQPLGISTDVTRRQSLVARLTPAGAPDAGFGQGGEAILGAGTQFAAVAVQADGKVVIAGTTGVSEYTLLNLNGRPQVTVARLTAAGAPDASFGGGTGSLDVLPAAINTFRLDSVAGLAIAPGGQILVASTLFTPTTPMLGPLSATVLSRVGADGTPDATFGTGGTLDISATVADVAGLVVQPDGAVVLAGTVGLGTARPFDGLVRLRGDGSVDSTFASVPLDAPVAPGGGGVIGPDRIAALALGADGEFTAAGGAYDNGIAVGGSYEAGRSLAVVKRYRADGTPDVRFGMGGRVAQYVAPSAIPGAGTARSTVSIQSVAVTPAGEVVAAGRLGIDQVVPAGQLGLEVGNQLVILAVDPAATRATAVDYDGDGKADVAAELSHFAAFADRPSSGGADVVQGFGPGGIDAAIPVTGDFDGDGKADLAVYIPAAGAFAYRPSGGGPDVMMPFGAAGLGQSIPAVGDFDGDGKADLAVYIPAAGAFAIHPSGGGMDELVPFGTAGGGMTVPAVGDYDGDGRADIAAYLPAAGVLAIRPSAGGPDVSVAFGSAGFGASIPTPADFDGDGKTDVAVYLPAAGAFAIHPSNGGMSYLVPFGRAGDGASIPAVADYDGDGKADPAVYLPADGLFADRPSTGGGDVVQRFGQPGPGATLPAAGHYDPTTGINPPTTSPGVAAMALDIPLTDDVLATLVGTRARKKS